MKRWAPLVILWSALGGCSAVCNHCSQCDRVDPDEQGPEPGAERTVMPEGPAAASPQSSGQALPTTQTASASTTQDPPRETKPGDALTANRIALPPETSGGTSPKPWPTGRILALWVRPRNAVGVAVPPGLAPSILPVAAVAGPGIATLSSAPAVDSPPTKSPKAKALERLPDIPCVGQEPPRLPDSWARHSCLASDSKTKIRDLASVLDPATTLQQSAPPSMLPPPSGPSPPDVAGAVGPPSDSQVAAPQQSAKKAPVRIAATDNDLTSVPKTSPTGSAATLTLPKSRGGLGSGQAGKIKTAAKTSAGHKKSQAAPEHDDRQKGTADLVSKAKAGADAPGALNRDRDHTGSTKTPAEQSQAMAADSQESSDSQIQPSEGANCGSTAPVVHLVNSKRISLAYDVKDVGPSGIADVELWYTQDGRTWQKHIGPPQLASPYVLEVEDEGIYGFTLIIRNGVGIGKQPPQAGELPQVWVEVDTTKPSVRLLGIAPGTQAGKLTILWTASDKNLAARPITISYAEKTAGPWTPIAARLKNTGRYVWGIPARAPHRFLIRVEAIDKVGNVGVAQTPAPLLGDVAPPSVSIREVHAAPSESVGQ